jgi:hypothetical protein
VTLAVAVRRRQIARVVQRVKRSIRMTPVLQALAAAIRKTARAPWSETDSVIQFADALTMV